MVENNKGISITATIGAIIIAFLLPLVTAIGLFYSIPKKVDKLTAKVEALQFESKNSVSEIKTLKKDLPDLENGINEDFKKDQEENAEVAQGLTVLQGRVEKLEDELRRDYNVNQKDHDKLIKLIEEMRQLSNDVRVLERSAE